MYNIDIILDVSAKDSMQTVTAKQHDGLRTLTAAFTIDGVPMSLNVGDDFRLRVLDDQNLQHIINGTVDTTTDTVTFDLTDAIQIHGKTIAECAYYNSSAQVLSSTVFCLNVIPDTTPGNYVSEETLRDQTLKGLRREPTKIIDWTNTTGSTTTTPVTISRDMDGNPFLIKNSFSIYIEYTNPAAALTSVVLSDQNGDFVCNLNNVFGTTAPRYYRARATYDGYQWDALIASTAPTTKLALINEQIQYDAVGTRTHAGNALSAITLSSGFPSNTIVKIYGENYAGLA